MFWKMSILIASFDLFYFFKADVRMSALIFLLNTKFDRVYAAVCEFYEFNGYFYLFLY